MQASGQYTDARKLATSIRAKYSLITARVMVTDLRKIYQQEGIQQFEYWDKFSTRIKGAYFNDEHGTTVVISKRLITQVEPKVFTMAHELKHHLADNVSGVSFCSNDNEKILVERAADAFASELIYPASLVIQDMRSRNIEKGKCTASDIVRLKHETRTTLSHFALALKIARLGYCDATVLKTRWHILRNQLYPEYTTYQKARAAF
jgi:Zn-dependent peptidase ImmA (M78 family)